MNRLSPTERRIQAILGLVEKHAHGIDDPRTEKALEDYVEELVNEITALHNLGKTSRWHEALACWIDAVWAHPHNLHWALHQGSIWASNAA